MKVRIKDLKELVSFTECESAQKYMCCDFKDLKFSRKILKNKDLYEAFKGYHNSHGGKAEMFYDKIANILGIEPIEGKRERG